MRLHVLSDLHIEFADFEPPKTDSNVVVLAGDIGVGIAALDWAKSHFKDVPVIYVLGNHEFYHHDLSLVADFKRAAPGNFHVLDNESVIIDGVRFLGSTLWTDFELFGEAERYFAMRFAGRGMMDFEVIRNGDRAFSPEDALRLHRTSRAWLEKALAEPFEGPTIVVTHHAPSSLSVAPRFKTDALSPAFASRLEALIERHAPALWIHGHMHDAFDYEIFDTRVICNPRGYPEESKQGFRPGLSATVKH